MMQTTYTLLNPHILKELTQLVDTEDLLTDIENLEKYGRDETEDLLYKPEVVVKPKTVEQISNILNCVQ